MNSAMLKQKKGFTLMEVLAVVFIMAVLAAIMLPALRRVREGGRVTHARNEINQLIASLDMYSEDWGYYPADDGAATYGSASLIAALRDGGYATWPDFIISGGNLLDPWGNPYVYRNRPTIEGRAQGVAFNIYSLGPDGVYGTEDDITNW